MPKRIRLDDHTEKYLNQVISNMRKLGLHHISKPDALRIIIRENISAGLKVKRKPKSKKVMFY